MEDEEESIWQRIAARITDFSGTITFLIINFVAFFLWIVLNTIGPTPLQFDRYPFQFLTFSVSLEAIFLSIFVLITQSKQAKKDSAVIAKDYEVNMQSEQRIHEVLERMALQDQELYRQTQILINLIREVKIHD